MPKSSNRSQHAVKTAANGAKFYGTFNFPISPCVRAGDFVITSAFPGHMAEHDDQVYTAEGLPLSSAKFRNARSFADETHACFKRLIDVLALADCELTDVIDCQVWLKDPQTLQSSTASTCSTSPTHGQCDRYSITTS